MFAAYRKVPILTGAPRRVVFTVRPSNSIYRTPRDTIVNRLIKRPDADSKQDLIRVQELPQFEVMLALLTTSRLFPNADIFFDGFDARGQSYISMLTGMPIIYVAGGATPTVLYMGLRESPAKKKPVRAISPNQYLKTMRVHRYLRYIEESESRSG